MIGINHAVGATSGLFLWMVVWWLYWHDECPVKHTVLIAAVATAQLMLSSNLWFGVSGAAGWDILGYILLTGVGVYIAVTGYITVEIDHGTDFEIDSETIEVNK